MRKLVYLCSFLLIANAGCFEPPGLINLFIFFGNATAECEAAVGDRTPDDFGLEFENFTVESANGSELAGWFIYSTFNRPHGTVMLNNPSIGVRPCFLSFIDTIARSGYNVVTYDYQGFGESEGLKNIKNVIDDARAVLEWIIDSDDPQRQSVAMIGVSLGAGPSIKLAGEYPELVWAVVLDSAYSIPPVLPPLPIIQGLVDSLLPGILEQFPPEMNTNIHIADMSAPLLMLHGSEDTRVGIDGALDLFETAPNPVKFVEFIGLGHVEALFIVPELYQEKVFGFLDEFAP